MDLGVQRHSRAVAGDCLGHVAEVELRLGLSRRAPEVGLGLGGVLERRLSRSAGGGAVVAVGELEEGDVDRVVVGLIVITGAQRLGKALRVELERRLAVLAQSLGEPRCACAGRPACP